MPTRLRGAEITDYSDSLGNTVVGTPKASAGAFVEFIGSGCSVTFDEGTKLDGAIIFRRDNSTVIIGKGSMYRGRMSLGLDCTVSFGTRIYCGKDVQVTTAEGTSLTLGNDLLIGDRCCFRTDDSHPLYDGVTGRRLNASQSITVEKHVWIGQEVYLMPGSHVGSGSVIGARSMVTKSRPIPPNSLAIGTPARVHRSQIHWVRKHLQRDDDVPDSIAPIFAPATARSRIKRAVKRTLAFDKLSRRIAP